MLHCSRVLMAGAMAAVLCSGAMAQPRAVVELFTSQGCSSCPPADRLLAELAKNPDVIALSLPVDYWDHLGWKDSLADPRHTARQWAYSRTQGARGVYTPQAMVNGVVGVVGSDRDKIEDAIAKTRHKAMAVAVRLVPRGDTITVSVAGGNASDSGEVWLCGVTRAVDVNVGRGENSGRSITYVNVGRSWIKLGEWNGAAAEWSVPISSVRTAGVDSAVVIVQAGTEKKPGLIFGAAFAEFR